MPRRHAPPPARARPRPAAGRRRHAPRPGPPAHERDRPRAARRAPAAAASSAGCGGRGIGLLGGKRVPAPRHGGGPARRPRRSRSAGPAARPVPARLPRAREAGGGRIRRAAITCGSCTAASSCGRRPRPNSRRRAGASGSGGALRSAASACSTLSAGRWSQPRRRVPARRRGGAAGQPRPGRIERTHRVAVRRPDPGGGPSAARAEAAVCIRAGGGACSAPAGCQGRAGVRCGGSSSGRRRRPDRPVVRVGGAVPALRTRRARRAVPRSARRCARAGPRTRPLTYGNRYRHPRPVESLMWVRVRRGAGVPRRTPRLVPVGTLPRRADLSSRRPGC